MSTPARSSRLANNRSPLLASLLLLAPLALSSGACKVDKAAFESRIFKCDTTAPDPLCGTDADGKAMTCFAARQIGGTDFCTKSCDTPMSLPDQNAVCVQGGAQLNFCNPDDDNDKVTHPLGACDRADLGCLRTDVESGSAEGICITGNPCSADTDCRDPVRSTCAATFLKELYQGAKNEIAGDHLYCLQEGCKANNQACSPGETCLRAVVPAAANPPDICVPNCDSNGLCPPNHFCLSRVSGPANPKVCIPGLLGFVCETDVDCIVGKCLSDADPTPLKFCTTTCDRDQDCSKYDSVQGHFVCSEDHRCITPDAYTGTLCRTDDDCGVRDLGTKCRRSPLDPTAPTTCLRPCDPTAGPAACPARGGIGHTCLPFVDAVDPTKVAYSCFPGNFGFPCFDKSQCAVPDLNCVGVDATTSPPTPGFCTPVCTSDADCTSNRWTGGAAYCGGAALPVCIPLAADGAPCEADKQCQSQTCAVPEMSGAPASADGGAEAGVPTKTCGGK